jgi:hypothetical protein
LKRAGVAGKKVNSRVSPSICAFHHLSTWNYMLWFSLFFVPPKCLRIFVCWMVTAHDCEAADKSCEPVGSKGHLRVSCPSMEPRFDSDNG